MKAISLFSGVGGFDLGFERAGIQTVLQAEQDPHCLAVLERHWPHVRRVNDVRLVATHEPFDMCPSECEEGCVQELECIGIQEILDEWEQIDVIHGGFPCQDISAARDRWGATGLDGQRSGLFYEFLRVIEIVRPRWAIIENVDRLRTGRAGSDFRAVLEGLDRAGYLGIGAVLDGSAFGLPASRRSVFLMARRAGDARSVSEWQGLAERIAGDSTGCVVLERTGQPLAADYGRVRPDPSSYRKLTPLECERLQGFPDNWTAGQADSHRYRQMGNAVCVPVAEWIGHRLMAVDAS